MYNVMFFRTLMIFFFTHGPFATDILFITEILKWPSREVAICVARKVSILLDIGFRSKTLNNISQLSFEEEKKKVYRRIVISRKRDKAIIPLLQYTYFVTFE